MPKYIRRQKHRRHDGTRVSGKWTRIRKSVFGYAGWVAAVAAVWANFVSPTPYQYSDLQNRKTALESQVRELEKEEEKAKSKVSDLIEKGKYLEERNNTLSDMNLYLTNINAKLIFEVKELGRETEEAKLAIFNLGEEGKQLVEQNNILSDMNSYLASINTKLVDTAFFLLVDSNIAIMGSNPVMYIVAQGETGRYGYHSTGIRCAEFDKSTQPSITTNCWRKTIKRLKGDINKNFPRGEKTKIIPLYLTTERLFMDSIEKMERWYGIDTRLTYELRAEVQSYIQNNPDNLRTPLNFDLTPKFRPKFRGFKTRLICVKGRPTLALPADESPAIAL
jgi:hypothetical protein